MPDGFFVRRSRGRQEAPPAIPAGAPGGSRERYIEALLAEIRILIRAVANSPEKRIADIHVKWIEDRDGKKLSLDYDYPMIVAKIACYDNTMIDCNQLGCIGFFQAVKDQLTVLTCPANGLSIAYTSLVVGNQRDDKTETTNMLAKIAYSNLESGARRHKKFITFLAILAVLLSFFAAWEATKVSFGRNLLQVLESLHAREAVIAADKFNLERTLDKGALNSLTADQDKELLLPVCLRHSFVEKGMTKEQAEQFTKSGVLLHASSEIRELCGRDYILQSDFEIGHYGLQRYQFFWPDLAGGIHSIIGRTLNNVRHLSFNNVLHLSFATTESYVMPDRHSCFNPDEASGNNSSTQKEFYSSSGCRNLELIATPILQVTSNYTLPFTFGIIGSLLYVLLHHHGAIRTNTLNPRDRSLAWLRVILGIVVAACVSLLVTSYAGPSAPIQQISGSPFVPGTLAGSLTLSASAITFLAGFGAEAVFTMLQGLVERIFVVPKQPATVHVT